MTSPRFEYGPFARGLYMAMLGVTVFMPIFGWEYFVKYLLLLLFLGLFLRPLLQITGLYKFLQHFSIVVGEQSDKKFLEKRRSEIDTKNRRETERKRRVKDPELPPGW